MTYEETLHYLYTSIPVFQNAGPSAYKPGLGTSIALDDHLGNPDIRSGFTPLRTWSTSANGYG